MNGVGMRYIIRKTGLNVYIRLKHNQTERGAKNTKTSRGSFSTLDSLSVFYERQKYLTCSFC